MRQWYLQDEVNVREALALLQDFVNDTCELIAPDHLHYEVSNAISMGVQRARLTVEEGDRAIAQFLALPLTTLSDNGLLSSAYQLSRQYRCAFYDAVYLALAVRTNLPLVVADWPFYRRVRHLPLVLWIADYARL